MTLFCRQTLLRLSPTLALFFLQGMLSFSIAREGGGKATNISSPSLVAGFRAAYNLSTYPDYQFPSAAYWTTAGNAMAEKFNGAGPAAIWIVSLYLDDGVTQLGFPSAEKRPPYIAFAPWDYSEAHLSHFDSTGLKVWLQIEPGAADVETLIDLVLRRYGHHPCVIGLGIDVEWYHANSNSHGRKVTDAEAVRWELCVQSFNPRYRLFLKHYAENWMPPTYRGNILFMDDSQRFYSLAEMIEEFRTWGIRFFPNDVAFQFGYPADKPWWSALSDPAEAVGKALLVEIPNAYGLFWVDFTITEIFPARAPAEKKSDAKIEPSFTIELNHLLSNPPTNITFNVPDTSQVRIEVYNVNGELINAVVDQKYGPGVYHAQWNGTNLENMPVPSGLYYYSMKTAARTLTKSQLLLR